MRRGGVKSRERSRRLITGGQSSTGRAAPPRTRPSGVDRRYRGAMAGASPQRRRVRPDLWAGWRPNGVGEVKPNHYGEIFRTVWENRDSLSRAWAILTKGVCDGCALGTAGLHDWTIDGVHLCTIRLNLLRLNTMGPLDPAPSATCPLLRPSRARNLRDLGRLAHPMVRRRGEAGFRRVTWGEALDLVADRLRRYRPGKVRPLPHVEGSDQRDLLRGPEVGPFPRIAQHRQCGEGLPCPLHNGAQRGDRVRGDHRLVHRPVRSRPGRPLRQPRRQRPTGDDEVPLPGAQAGAAGGRGQPLPRACAGAVLGPLQPGERPLRHPHHRRVLPDPHRGRHRVRPRCPQGDGGEAKAPSTSTSSPMHTEGWPELRADGGGGRCGRTSSVASGSTRARDGAFCRGLRRGPVRHPHLVDGRDPARLRIGQRARHRQPGAWREATSAAPVRG